VAIIHNLHDRIKEAQLNEWLGEIEGLQTSLDAAAGKLASLDRMRNRPTNQVTLGIPVVRAGDRSAPSDSGGTAPCSPTARPRGLSR
jgi:hypothetical protein